MKKVIKAIIIIAILCTVAFAAYRAFYKNNEEVLKFSGELEMKLIDISFRVSGQITERYVDEGAPVKKDELLAELDPSEYQYQLNLAVADELAAKWALTELNAGNTQEDIEQAKKQLESAKSEYNRAEKEYKRTKNLFEQGSIAATEYDKVTSAYNVAGLKVGELSEHVKQMVIGPRNEKIEQAKANLEAATANRELAAKRLTFAKIYSPIDGVVINEYKEVGEFVQSGAPILSVGNPLSLWLRAYLPEDQAHIIKLGQKMSVTVDSLPGQSFEGVVSFISDNAEFTPKQIQTAKERVKLVYRIKIDILDTKGLLKPGIPADAVIKE